jgi:hypothetical protein
MTVHRNILKWIKPTDTLNSSFIGMKTLHVSGSLSAHHQEFWAVHRLWYIICSCGDRLLLGVGWHWMCHATLGSKRSPQLHIMYQSRGTAQNSWWWAETLPETCRVVIQIKLEFSVSVGLIHFSDICNLSCCKKLTFFSCICKQIVHKINRNLSYTFTAEYNELYFWDYVK